MWWCRSNHHSHHICSLARFRVHLCLRSRWRLWNKYIHRWDAGWKQPLSSLRNRLREAFCHLQPDIRQQRHRRQCRQVRYRHVDPACCEWRRQVLHGSRLCRCMGWAKRPALYESNWWSKVRRHERRLGSALVSNLDRWSEERIWVHFRSGRLFKFAINQWFEMWRWR